MTESSFSPDAPIESREQDRLGLSPFVKRLAAPILLSPLDRSLVIGLYGRWGSGKTSALQLLKQELEATQRFEGARGRRYPHARVISFTPWLYGSVEALLSAFFDTLASGIGGLKGAPKATRASAEGGLRFMATFLQPTLTAAANLARVVPSAELRLVGEAAAAAAKGGSEWLDVTRGVADEARFQRQKAKAAKALRKLGEQGQPVRVVMLIDDLDRSSSVDEVLLMLKLVKLVADLPNVAYVVAMDREHVESLLRRVGSERFADEYLDKIVQVGVTVPPSDPSRLAAWLIEEARAIAQAVEMPTDSVELQEESGAFDYIELRSFRRLVSEAIRTPRDVNRVLNLYRFAAATGEVPPPFHAADLLLLSILQVVAPAVHRAVQLNGRFLCGQERSINEALRDHAAARDQAARNAARFEKIVHGDADAAVAHAPDSVPGIESDRPRGGYAAEVRGVRRILEHLFPAMSKAYRPLVDVAGGDRTGYRADRVDYRLRSPVRFNAYFRLSQGDAAPPRALINEVLALLTTPTDGGDALWGNERSQRLKAAVEGVRDEQRTTLLEEVAYALWALPLPELRVAASVLPRLLRADGFRVTAVITDWSIEIGSALTATVFSGIPRARQVGDWERDGLLTAELVRTVAEAVAQLSVVEAVNYVGDVVRERDIMRAIEAADRRGALLARCTGWINEVLAKTNDLFAAFGWETASRFIFDAHALGGAATENGAYRPLRDHLRGLLERRPDRLTHMLALAAWWSGGHPSLKDRGDADTVQSLDRLVGCDCLDDVLRSTEGESGGALCASDAEQEWPHLVRQYIALRSGRPDDSSSLDAP